MAQPAARSALRHLRPIRVGRTLSSDGVTPTSKVATGRTHVDTRVRHLPMSPGGPSPDPPGTVFRAFLAAAKKRGVTIEPAALRRAIETRRDQYVERERSRITHERLTARERFEAAWIESHRFRDQALN